MADPITMARIGLLLGDEQNRKRLGWVMAAILSPIILVVALLCVLGSGAVEHNISAAQLCFQNGPLPDDTPAEYRVCIEQTRTSFAELDTIMADIQSNMNEGNSLDATRVKAVFFSLYFGGEAPPLTQFAHCFATSEIRTRTVTEKDADGNDIQVEQTYTVLVPIEDMAKVYDNLTASLGVSITASPFSHTRKPISACGRTICGSSPQLGRESTTPCSMPVSRRSFRPMRGSRWRSPMWTPRSWYGSTRHMRITMQRSGLWAI